MKYELIIETEVCTAFSNFPHNREGFISAFEKLGNYITKDNFKSAQIISIRNDVHDIVFQYPSAK